MNGRGNQEIQWQVDPNGCQIWRPTDQDGHSTWGLASQNGRRSVHYLPWSLLWHKLSHLSQTNTLVYLHHSQSWCDSHTSLSEALITDMQPGVDALAVAPAPGCMANRPWPLQAVLHITPRLHLSISSPVGCSLYWYSPSRTFTCQVPH